MKIRRTGLVNAQLIELPMLDLAGCPIMGPLQVDKDLIHWRKREK
jgi:hypothetical protein